MSTRYYAKETERWRIKADTDTDPSSPRNEYGNIGTILLPHGLGDNGMDIGSDAYRDMFEACYIVPMEVIEGMVGYYIGPYGYLEVDDNGIYHTTDGSWWDCSDEGTMMLLFLDIVDNIELHDVIRICNDDVPRFYDNKLFYRYLSLQCGPYDYLRTSETDTVNQYLGIIWTTSETVSDKLSCGTLNTETILSFLDNEVSEYAAYLAGDVYAATIERLGKWGWEAVDMIGGFINESEDEMFAAAEEMYNLNGYQVSQVKNMWRRRDVV